MLPSDKAAIACRHNVSGGRWFTEKDSSCAYSRQKRASSELAVSSINLHSSRCLSSIGVRVGESIEAEGLLSGPDDSERRGLVSEYVDPDLIFCRADLPGAFLKVSRYFL
jgi:hypothetical protein